MEAMSKICSPCGSEVEEKRVTSLSPEDDFSIQDVRKDDKLKSAEAELGEVKEENERLTMMLEQVEKDYHSLQLRFCDILRKEVSKKGASDSATTLNETEEPELVSLCLGRSPREPNKDARIGNSNQPKENEDLEACLTLGLDSKCLLSIEQVSDPCRVNGSEDPKEVEAERALPTRKSAKEKNMNDEISDQNQMPAKRARVSVRARCDAPTMNDGCQWRKYGQKIAKGNPCPRAYYRCTVAPACPVRKQVQRCADDLSILITTYEGTHNHPLPFSATAITSTTSAAASMFLSGSSTTSQLRSHNSASFGNVPTVLNGQTFTHQFDLSRAKQILLPKPNHASHMYPTITLDLTSASSSLSTHAHCLPSSIASNPRFSPTSLSFYSPETNMAPPFWVKGFPNNGTMPIDKTHMSPVILRNQFQQHIYQQCLKNQTPPKEALAETITKAISTEPSLRSVIAAAVSSIVGHGSSAIGNQHSLPFSLSKSSTSTSKPASIIDQINN